MGSGASAAIVGASPEELRQFAAALPEEDKSKVAAALAGTAPPEVAAPTAEGDEKTPDPKEPTSEGGEKAPGPAEPTSEAAAEPTPEAAGGEKAPSPTEPTSEAAAEPTPEVA